MMLIDAIGQRHRPVDPATANVRIVSLVPSITELLCDLGLQDFLVGRTGFCIHPKRMVQSIAKVGGTKDVNIEKIRILAPTHLIVNIDENEKPTVDTLAQFIPHVVVTHPNQPSDNVMLYRLLGGIFGAQKKAEELCAAFDHAYLALKQQRQCCLPQKVLYCIWKDPWMTVSGDTYIGNMLAEIGWHQWVAHPDGTQLRYPTFNWSQELVAAIDCVLLSSEPYRFGAEHADALEKQIGKPVHLVDGEMLSWYGSRAIQGLDYLRQLAGEASRRSGYSLE
jgi:ABC-type Fe3+-hydroxamate transport system substrate-binding protein